ncbi:hypothetical protein [Paenibacillus sp. N3.4]|uniref:hypothetical protein n=1 Tax=Paenibacillus sp. N3.4 TaxID=2603222 RepID=UPI0021C3E9ED|nr:hypothetical protein [Paenibacillus sp. N3.4]
MSNLSTHSRMTKANVKRRVQWFDVFVFILLILLSAIMLMPSINMFSSAFKTQADILKFPPSIIPSHFAWENFSALFKGYDYLVWYKNSLFIAVICVFGTVISSALVAYGFTRFKAKGKVFSLFACWV